MHSICVRKCAFLSNCVNMLHEIYSWTKPKRLLSTCFVLLAVSACAPRREASIPSIDKDTSFTDTLYIAPDGYRPGNVIYCSGTRDFSCLLSRQDGSDIMLVHNGAKIAEGNGFGIIAFSSNGRRFIYSIRDQRRRWTIVDNDVKYGPYDEVFHWTMTKDGLHFAYEVIDGNPRRYSVIRDGKPLGMEFRNSCSPVFSPDGTHFAYKAILENNRCFIVLDDNALEVRDSVDNPIFTRDGQQMAYTAYDNGDCYLQLNDGQKVGPYFMILDSCLSPDGRKYAFVAKRKISEEDAVLLPRNERNKLWTYHAVASGFESQAFDNITSPCFSDDSKHLMFRVLINNSWRILLDGEIMSGVDGDIWRTEFIPPDNRVAYAVKNGNQWRVVCGDRESADYDDVHSIHSTPDGEVYFIASKGRKVLRVKLK
jgi:hypothetical protein